MARINRRNKKKTEQIEIVPKDENPPLPPQRDSDETVPKKKKWINKQRVLVFAARGISHRDRHLMNDIRTLMPHHRPESKLDRTKTLSIINEISMMKHCNKAILFEGRRKRDLYMWLANIPNGPSAKFLVENIHTMAELKMTGNCLRGSRPLLSFDDKFTQFSHLIILKELLVQIFGVPNYHPKSQPFFDHVYTFTYLDRRIWFRNFQILSEDGGLAEIGPRFILNPVKIFEGSFGNLTLWENTDYVSPAKQRQMLKKAAKDRYVNRVEQKAHREATMPTQAYESNQYDEIFSNRNPIATAKVLTDLSAKSKLKQLDNKSGKVKKSKSFIKPDQMEAAKEIIINRKKSALKQKQTKKATIKK